MLRDKKTSAHHPINKIFSMPSDLVRLCADEIADRKMTIAFIESATAGRMCCEFALTENSGNILRGGVSCYEVFVKENILHVSHSLIEKYTAESAEVTQALAISGKKLFESDIVVAVTGLTSPGGSENKNKPVGTMFIDMLIHEKHVSARHVFAGTPESIMLQTIDKAAELILDNLETD